MRSPNGLNPPDPGGIFFGIEISSKFLPETIARAISHAVHAPH
jgi:hypothetical protein